MDGRRRTAQGHERRQQLLDAAAGLIAAKGFAATRVADVADAAGVAKGLVYWYFETKDALFQELVDTTRQRLRAAQSAAIDRRASPLLQLRQGCEATARYMVAHPDAFAAFRTESATAPMAAVLHASGAVHQRDTARLVEAAIRFGQVHDEDPEALAVGVVGIVTSYVRAHRTGRLDLGVEELSALVARTVVRALSADDAVRREIELSAHRHACAPTAAAATGTRHADHVEEGPWPATPS